MDVKTLPPRDPAHLGLATWTFEHVDGKNSSEEFRPGQGVAAAVWVVRAASACPFGQNFFPGGNDLFT